MDYPIIPKPLKRFKGTVFLNFTWFDIAFLTLFAILIILLWSFVSINYWLLFAITIFLIAMPIFLTIPIYGKKGYIQIYYALKFLFSKKYYFKREVKLLYPYQNIDQDGFIKMKNGSFILPINLTGFNIHILQQKEQMIRINSFQNLIRSIEQNFSIVKVNLPNSLQTQEELLLNQITKTKNKAYRKALQDNLDVLATLKARELNYSDQYFLLLYGDKEKLQIVKKRIINQLKMAFLAPKINSKDLSEQLINSYYGNQNLNNISKVSFKSSYIKIGEKLLRIYAVTTFGNYAYLGWLTALNVNKNCDWAIKVATYDQLAATKKLDKAIKALEIETISTKKASQDVQKNEYLSAMYDLNQQVHGNGETLKSTYTFIKIEANNLKQLNEISGDLENQLKGNNIKFSNLKHLQKEGFESMLPKSTLSARKISALELPSLAFAFGFPFMSEHLKDPRGIYLGYTTNSDNNIYFDIFQQDDYRTNSNAIILGTSGSGKSTTSMKLIKDQLLLGNKVIAIDPEREYKKLCQKLDGKWVNFGSDKLTNKDESIINPLQFFKNESDDREMLASHLQFLEQFFKTLFPDLSLIELNILREVLIEVYQNKKIDASNSQSFIHADKFPKVSDVSENIKNRLKNNQDDILKSIFKNLNIYFSVFTNPNAPEYKLWNGYTNFNAHQANFIVMDTHTLGESGNKRLSNAQLFLLLKFVNSMMVQNKILKEKKQKLSKKMMIVIDEAHLLIDEKQPFGLDFMYQMVKRARKYDALTMITTQNVKDFVGGSQEIQKKTRAIINTSQYSFLLGMNPGDIEDLDNLYQSVNGLTELEKETLSTARQGSGILAIGPKQRKMIQVDLSDQELELLAH